MATNLVKFFLKAALFGLFLIGTFFWFEAEKEVRILCGMFQAGQSEGQVTQTLNTANLLEYRSGPSEDGQILTADSPYMLRTGYCTVHFSSEGIVQSASYIQAFKLERAAAWVSVIGFILAVSLELLAAAGDPSQILQKNPLSHNHRIILRIYALTMTIGALFLLEGAEITHLLPNTINTAYAVWSLVPLLGSAIGINRRWKVQYITPILVVLLCCSIIVGMAD